MALDFQTVAIAFTEGMDTRDQKKLVVRGKWEELRNLTLSQDGSLRTRDGCAALQANALGNGLATYNKELLVVSGPSVSSVTSVSAYAQPGSIGNVGVRKTAEIIRPFGVPFHQDCAHGNGHTAYVYVNANIVGTAVDVSVTLVNEATGTHVLDDYALRTAATVGWSRVVFADDAFFIFYQDSATTTLYCVVIETAAPNVVGTETALVPSVSLGFSAFDVCSFSNTGSGAFNSVAAAVRWTDGATSVRAFTVIRTGTTPSIPIGTVNVFTEVPLPTATVSGLAIAAYSTGDRVGVFARSTGATALAGVAGRVFNPATMAFTTAATQLDTSVAAVAGPSSICAGVDAFAGMRVFYDELSDWNSNAINPLRCTIVTSALGIVSGPTTIINSATFAIAAGTARGPLGPFIYGKPFTANSRTYLPVVAMESYILLAATSANNNQQNTVFVLDCGAQAIVVAAVAVARALYGSFGTPQTPGGASLGFAPSLGTPTGTPTLAVADTFALTCHERSSLQLYGGLNIAPVGLSKLTLTPNASIPPSRTQLGESAYFSGGQLTAYDGAGVVEHGFPLFPEGIGLALVVGGGAMTAGVHQVVAMWEWTDAGGQRHQSAPSLPVSMTTALNDRITVTVPTLLLSQKTNIQLVVGVTTAAGLSFYRANLNNAAFAPVFNTTAAATVTYTLADSDATVSANELLYTQPNIAGTTLPNVSPAPCSTMAVIHKRLWLDRSDAPGTYAYSQKYINNLGLQFNDVLGGSVPLDAGNIVAISALDEKVIIFCERKLFVVYGTGPNPNGTFDNYSDPQEIPSDGGCSAGLSVLRLPQGIVYKTKKGWYLLNRGLACGYIGAGVASFDSETVTSAVLLESEQEARFLTTTGTTLVLSYMTGDWSYYVYSKLEALYAPVDAMWWPTASSGAGGYVHISTAHGLSLDTPGVYSDQVGVLAAEGILTLGRTSWIRVGELERFQRVKSLYVTCTSSAAPTGSLLVSVDFDDEETTQVAPGSFIFGFNLATAFPTWIAGKSLDLRGTLSRQKCKSVRFTFTENPATASTVRLNGMQALALEVGLKRGLNKLPAAQSK